MPIGPLRKENRSWVSSWLTTFLWMIWISSLCSSSSKVASTRPCTFPDWFSLVVCLPEAAVCHSSDNPPLQLQISVNAWDCFQVDFLAVLLPELDSKPLWRRTHSGDLPYAPWLLRTSPPCKSSKVRLWARPQLCWGQGMREAELSMAQPALSQPSSRMDSMGTKKIYSFMSNKSTTGPANELGPESACHLYSEFLPKTIDFCDISFSLLLKTYRDQK